MVLTCDYYTLGLSQIREVFCPPSKSIFLQLRVTFFHNLE